MAEETARRRLGISGAGGGMKQDWAPVTVRWLTLSTIAIFCVETLIMLVLEVLLPLPKPLVLVFDGLFLAMLLFPLNYVYIVRPMSSQIEKQRQMNQDLIQSNEMLERFFSIEDILVAYYDSNFHFVRVNHSFAQTNLRSAEDFIGRNHFDLFPDEETEQVFERVVKSGRPYYAFEKHFVFANGEEPETSFWDWSLLPVKDPHNQVIALILVLTNRTARKQAELARDESERRFRAVFNQTFQHIGLLDPSGQVLIFNQTALDFLGAGQADVVGNPLWQLSWWKDADIGAHLQEKIYEAGAGEVVRCEHQIQSDGGEVAIMDITIKPFLDQHGKAILLIYEARDITERIRTEEALRNGEEEIKRLYQAEMRAHYLAETLRSAGLSMSGSLNSETVLETLLDHLFKMVPYTSAHISLLDDEDHLTVRLTRGEESWDENNRILGKRFEIDDLPFFQPLLENRQVLSIPDTLLYPGTPFFLNDHFVRSWLGIPLLAVEQVIGVCVLEHTCPNFFTEDLIHWSRALTSQASVAMQNAWLFEQVRDGREHLQALSRRLVEAQESERHHIAMELHDESGQALASLMVGLKLLERDGGDAAAVTARCHELKQIADGVLENLHRLSMDLRPATLDHLGLVSALRQHTVQVSDTHGLIVQFEAIGRIERLPGEMETAIYRIVQEALTNVVRHAFATHVDILLERRGDLLIVVVEDDGIGFDPHTLKVGQLGMLGMRERADMLGGTITIESSPGKGSTILLEVPCPSEF